MSVIKTERGWIELGAGNPLEQAYETTGHRAEGATVLAQPEPFIPQWDEFTPTERTEWVRAWNVRLAEHVGVTNRFNRDGSVTFGKYGPGWTI